MKQQTKILASILMLLLFAAPAFGASCHDDEKAPDAVAVSEESIYNVDSEWTNQAGEKISIRSLAGRPRLVAMGFTSCQTACPLLISEMKRVASLLSKAEQEKIGLTMFSFDSVRDTPEALRAFQKKMKIEGANWSLFQSEPANVTELAAIFGIQFKKLDSGDFVHSNVIFLLNEKGEVLARKDGLNSSPETFVKAIRQAVK